MNDLTIAKLCAEAMGLSPIVINGGEVVIGVTPHRYVYRPLRDDAQVMALVKKFKPRIQEPDPPDYRWCVTLWDTTPRTITRNADLNCAICECVAKLQASRQSEGKSCKASNVT